MSILREPALRRSSVLRETTCAETVRRGEVSSCFFRARFDSRIETKIMKIVTNMMPNR